MNINLPGYLIIIYFFIAVSPALIALFISGTDRSGSAEIYRAFAVLIPLIAPFFVIPFVFDGSILLLVFSQLIVPVVFAFMARGEKGTD